MYHTCYTPTELVSFDGTSSLNSPYECDLLEGHACRAYDQTQSNTIFGVKCMCRHSYTQTDGKCAWTGPSSYVNYFSALKNAVEGSFDCHFRAFDFFLRFNPFDANI